MAELSRFPERRLAIVTCMDCRIDPLAATGLELGDAHVIRNAGAIVTEDVRRSLALSQRALRTEEVWVVMHTGCGVHGLDDEELIGRIEAEAGVRPDWAPGGFESLDEELRTGCRRVAEDPVLASSSVRGFIFDIDSGELRELSVA